MRIVPFFVVAGIVCYATAVPSITNKLGSHLALMPQETGTVIVSMVNNKASALIQEAKLRTFRTKAARRTAMYNSLKSHADDTQANVITKLKKIKKTKPIEFSQLWITNQMVVKNCDNETAQELLAMPEVAGVRKERVFPVPEVMDLVVHRDGYSSKAEADWGVTQMGAPTVWNEGNTGEGVVIGTIDTGVRGSHVALVDNYRNSYGWYDPYLNTDTPNDQNGHGTHTMGTVAGANGIGVAPGVQWMACKGCNATTCDEGALLACGDWMACPTDLDGISNPDCSQAPDVVSNSWGGGQGDPWYEDTVNAWHAAGIIPVFSIGNAGPACGTASSPGDYENVIGVGSTTSNNTLSSFSSVGPPAADATLIKPDLGAPGSNIRSAYCTSDTAYAAMSGTSMACPHVAGAVALLLAQQPDLTFTQVRDALVAGCDTTAVTPTGNDCGDVDDAEYPNNNIGWGLVNCPASLESL